MLRRGENVVVQVAAPLPDWKYHSMKKYKRSEFSQGVNNHLETLTVVILTQQSFIYIYIFCTIDMCLYTLYIHSPQAWIRLKMDFKGEWGISNVSVKKAENNLNSAITWNTYETSGLVRVLAGKGERIGLKKDCRLERHSKVWWTYYYGYVIKITSKLIVNNP